MLNTTFQIKKNGASLRNIGALSVGSGHLYPKQAKALVSGEKFNLGDPVFVMSDPGSTEQDWVAVVKDIRARNASAVFLLAQWFYRPEELPGGRK